MSENNINNFQTLIEQRRIVKKIVSNMLLAVGSPDRKAVSDYRPVGILWEDLLAQIKDEVGGGSLPDEFCDITMTPLIVTLGPLVNFSTIGFGGPDDIVIPGALELRRNDDSTFFNSILEANSFSNFPNSPLDTEWNADGWGDFSDVNSRTFSTFWDATNDGDTYRPLGKQLIMRHIPTGRMWKTEFISWDTTFRTGAFEWNREELTVSDSCRLTFSDGTFMDTAPVPPEDFNTWNVRTTAFIDPLALPGTGRLGDGNNPFSSIAETTAGGYTNVVLLPGTYYGTNILNNNTTYYAYPGAKIGVFGKLSDGGVSKTAKVLGHLVFDSNSRGIETTAASNITVECDSFDNVQTVAFALGANANIFIKCRSIFSNCVNGGAYATSPRNGSTIEIECSSWDSIHWITSPSGSASTFILRCPNVRILAAGGYGNTAKGLINLQGNVVHTVDIDFMGGKYTNEAIQTVTFGVGESALGLYAVYTTTGPNVSFRNGYVECISTMIGLNMHYQITYGSMELENIKIKADRALMVRLTSFNGGGRMTMRAENCKFESLLTNRLGNGKECHFNNCTFKVTDPAATSIFLYQTENPANPLIAYFTNCSAELVNVGNGEFMENSIVGAVYGFWNTVSTEDRGTSGTPVVDTWGGFTELPAYKVSNI